MRVIECEAEIITSLANNTLPAEYTERISTCD